MLRQILELLNDDLDITAYEVIERPMTLRTAQRARDWIEALPDEDHVARARVQGLASRPERLEEVIGEIVMGRSILEG